MNSDERKLLTCVFDSAQFAHFVNDDKLNVFRLPFGWQFLLNNVLGGTLDPTNFARYDSLVQACLATGSYCIIDVSHAYAQRCFSTNA